MAANKIVAPKFYDLFKEHENNKSAFSLLYLVVLKIFNLSFPEYTKEFPFI